MTIEKCGSILINLQSMVASIDDSKQTAEVLASYQLASNTLRQAYTDSGLTADKVDDVLADVQEVRFILLTQIISLSFFSLFRSWMITQTFRMCSAVVLLN